MPLGRVEDRRPVVLKPEPPCGWRVVDEAERERARRMEGSMGFIVGFWG